MGNENTIKEKPVKVGEKRIVKITSEGQKGDGITRLDGFVIITKRAEINKTYEVNIQGVYSTYAIGKIVREIRSPKEINKELDEDE